MARHDIFGNLDNYLANDNNSCDTAELQELKRENARRNITKENPKRGKINMSLSKKRTAKASKDAVQTEKITACEERLECNTHQQTSDTVAPTPEHTEGISLHDMQELVRKYDFACCNPNPQVAKNLKKKYRFYYKTKQAFDKIHRSYKTKHPVALTEIAVFREKMKTVADKLDTLFVEAKNMRQAEEPNIATSGGRHKRPNLNLGPPIAVITLDEDDPPAVRPRRSLRLTGSTSQEQTESVITLDSDEETEAPCSQLDQSFEAENYEMRIKVKWGGNIETFNHRKHQKFMDIITQLAVREHADKECILLNLNDRVIYANDTPDTIGYKTYQFISGRILQEKAPTLSKAGPATSATTTGANLITLKVQLEKRKEPLRLQINKDQKMVVLVVKCAEELKCEPAKIRLYFDGELVNNDSKPEELELEGDEMLDVHMV
ncbi:uncharacterized protein LOC131216252 isoform X2 [Anopheles bellator]|uniref:uncharacterized protein LOC131216252 isoform X2 n=1 Tax=Anopheles bellator TaxID=139047 RepID=UPI00264865B0|nr:uncharacterized protein LOC131216252 isoform X2 [Anopheles bellator]